MTYLVSQIILFLIAANLLGLIIGWMLRSINADEKAHIVENKYKQKMLTTEKYHREEVQEFAQNTKRIRAEVSRLNTNNKALRVTIDNSNKTLEQARSEILLLSSKLKLQVKKDPEEDIELLTEQQLAIPTISNSIAGEFDETIALQQTRAFDSQVIEIKPEDFEDKKTSPLDSDQIEPDMTIPAELTVNTLWANIKDLVGNKEK